MSGKTFKAIGNDTPAITIRNCHNVRIVQNDFIDDAEPIFVTDSTDVTIEYNRYRNIAGPHERNGSNRGNFTQWVNSTGGSISHNSGSGGDTEDIISIYKSGGHDAGNPLVIADNRFEGTNWTSGSGSGMMLGDGGGSHVVVKDNVLVNPGQVGIGVAGGSDIRVTGNTILGQPRASSNVGIYVWGQDAGCSDIQVAGNTVDFAKPSGMKSGGWDGGNCGAISGWSSNDWTAGVGLGAVRVVL
ncbi:right-handed parallel beta-helix repeat-containing protein [uncultured Amnibacterium sp.]|uniref:right-handed parallel beta-helix repeat-containing protein n=1 Tax=uncultured Amnibacterium sp. TaxID=1631851 RepID=UPI0035CA6EAE